MIIAIITAGSAFLANVICNGTHNPRRYFLVFLITFLSSFVLDCFCFEMDGYTAKLNPSLVQTYIEKCEYHKNQGDMFYKNAQSLSWYWVAETDREKANYCFKVLIATMAASNPMSKAMAAAIAFIADYGMDVMDRWHLIRSNLLEAEYHYKMLEFYEEVLIKA